MHCIIQDSDGRHLYCGCVSPQLVVPDGGSITLLGGANEYVINMTAKTWNARCVVNQMPLMAREIEDALI